MPILLPENRHATHTTPPIYDLGKSQQFSAIYCDYPPTLGSYSTEFLQSRQTPPEVHPSIYSIPTIDSHIPRVTRHIPQINRDYSLMLRTHNELNISDPTYSHAFEEFLRANDYRTKDANQDILEGNMRLSLPLDTANSQIFKHFFNLLYYCNRFNIKYDENNVDSIFQKLDRINESFPYKLDYIEGRLLSDDDLMKQTKDFCVLCKDSSTPNVQLLDQILDNYFARFPQEVGHDIVFKRDYLSKFILGNVDKLISLSDNLDAVKVKYNSSSMVPQGTRRRSSFIESRLRSGDHSWSDVSTSTEMPSKYLVVYNDLCKDDRYSDFMNMLRVDPENDELIKKLGQNLSERTTRNSTTVDVKFFRDFVTLHMSLSHVNSREPTGSEIDEAYEKLMILRNTSIPDGSNLPHILIHKKNFKSVNQLIDLLNQPRVVGIPNYQELFMKEFKTLMDQNGIPHHLQQSLMDDFATYKTEIESIIPQFDLINQKYQSRSVSSHPHRSISNEFRIKEKPEQGHYLDPSEIGTLPPTDVNVGKYDELLTKHKELLTSNFHYRKLFESSHESFSVREYSEHSKELSRYLSTSNTQAEFFMDMMLFFKKNAKEPTSKDLDIMGERALEIIHTAKPKEGYSIFRSPYAMLLEDEKLNLFIQYQHAVHTNNQTKKSFCLMNILFHTPKQFHGIMEYDLDRNLSTWGYLARKCKEIGDRHNSGRISSSTQYLSRHVDKRGEVSQVVRSRIDLYDTTDSTNAIPPSVLLNPVDSQPYMDQDLFQAKHNIADYGARKGLDLQHLFILDKILNDSPLLISLVDYFLDKTNKSSERVFYLEADKFYSHFEQTDKDSVTSVFGFLENEFTNIAKDLRKIASIYRTRQTSSMPELASTYGQYTDMTSSDRIGLLPAPVPVAGPSPAPASFPATDKGSSSSTVIHSIAQGPSQAAGSTPSLAAGSDPRRAGVVDPAAPTSPPASFPAPPPPPPTPPTPAPATGPSTAAGSRPVLAGGSATGAGGADHVTPTSPSPPPPAPAATTGAGVGADQAPSLVGSKLPMTIEKSDEYNKELKSFFEAVKKYLTILKNAQANSRTSPVNGMVSINLNTPQDDELKGSLERMQNFLAYHEKHVKKYSSPENRSRDYLLRCYNNQLAKGVSSPYNLRELIEPFSDTKKLRLSLEEMDEIPNRSLTDLVRFLPQVDFSTHSFDDVTSHIPDAQAKEQFVQKLQNTAKLNQDSIDLYFVSHIGEKKLPGLIKDRQANLVDLLDIPTDLEGDVREFSRGFCRLKQYFYKIRETTSVPEIKKAYNHNRFAELPTDHIDDNFKKFAIPIFRELDKALPDEADNNKRSALFKISHDLYKDLCDNKIAKDAADAAAAAAALAPPAGDGAGAPVAANSSPPVPPTTDQNLKIKHLLKYATKSDGTYNYDLLQKAYVFCEKRTIDNTNILDVDKMFELDEWFRKQNVASISTDFTKTEKQDFSYPEFIAPFKPKKFLLNYTSAGNSVSSDDCIVIDHSNNLIGEEIPLNYPAITSVKNNHTRVVNIFQFTSKQGELITDNKIFLSIESEQKLKSSMGETKKLLDAFKELDIESSDMQSVIAHIKNHEDLKKGPFDLARFDSVIQKLLNKSDDDLEAFVEEAKKTHPIHKPQNAVLSDNLIDQLYGELLADKSLILGQSATINRVYKGKDKTNPVTINVSSTGDFKGTINIKSKGPTPITIDLREPTTPKVSRYSDEFTYSQYSPKEKTNSQVGDTLVGDTFDRKVLQKDAGSLSGRSYKSSLSKVDSDSFVIKPNTIGEFALFSNKTDTPTQIAVYDSNFMDNPKLASRVEEDIRSYFKRPDATTQFTLEQRTQKFACEVKILDADNNLQKTISDIKISRSTNAILGLASRTPEVRDGGRS
jgi:hypothetical protein